MTKSWCSEMRQLRSRTGRDSHAKSKSHSHVHSQQHVLQMDVHEGGARVELPG